MGRLTEYLHYINLDEEPSNEEKALFTSLTITKELEYLRKENKKLKFNKKEGDLFIKDDGSFSLF